MLAWLTDLPRRSYAKVLHGQQLFGNSPEEYLGYLNDLRTRTGRHPALVGIIRRRELASVDGPGAHPALERRWAGS